MTSLMNGPMILTNLSFVFYFSNTPNSSLHYIVLFKFCSFSYSGVYSNVQLSVCYVFICGTGENNYFWALTFVSHSNTLGFCLIHMLSKMQFPNSVLLFVHMCKEGDEITSPTNRMWTFHLHWNLFEQIWHHKWNK